MAFHCEYWNCSLDDVSEHQSDVCLRDGRTCEDCMVEADNEETG